MTAGSKEHLTGHEVSTTQECGWADLINGDLLRLLEVEGFDLIITADANLKHQQNIAARKVGVLVLRVPNNRLATHLEMLPQLIAVLAGIKPGDLVEVFHSKLERRD